MNRVFKYVLLDLVRSKIILFYALALLAISLSIFSISETTEKTIVSLLNIELIVIPLICGIFSTIYFYNSSEFIEVLVAQPIQRKTVFISILFGLSLALCFSFVLGVGIPLLIYDANFTTLLFIITGLAVTCIFSSFAVAIAVFAKDKARGIGNTLLIWFYFTLIYDGLVLFLLFRFSDYPMEKMITGLAFLNPIDLVRIIVLLQIDNAAIMGYTGALFKEYFSSNSGAIVCATGLLLWFLIPALIALKKFKRKDL
jgi:Cu-processing system permease protein